MGDRNKSQEPPRVALLGVGSMGGAILSGLRSPEARVARPIAVTTASTASAARFADAEDVVAWSGEADSTANQRAARDADIVVLGVKPWLVDGVIREIASELKPEAVLVSLAAGVTVATMEAAAPGFAVVRAMPNTPAHVGLGVTGLCAGREVTAPQMAAVSELFATVGEVLAVHEDQMNALAAVSGSGPAYLFLYVEKMTAAAQRLGFTEDHARLLAEQTAIGAAELLRASDETPEQLRQSVTSAGGITERAVEVLQEGGLDELLDRALAANIQRSEELSAQ